MRIHVDPDPEPWNRQYVRVDTGQCFEVGAASWLGSGSNQDTNLREKLGITGTVLILVSSPPSHTVRDAKMERPGAAAKKGRLRESTTLDWRS